MADIFISYSHKDKAYAHRLARTLENIGFSVWLDDRIDYGTQWPQEIQNQLDSCDVFIVVVSENSYESEWVQSEVIRAKRKGKSIIPLLLQGDPWLSIEATQYIDVTGGNLPPDTFYERLEILTDNIPEDEFKQRRYEYIVSEWPLYVNKKHGFSFRYPLEAKLTEDDGDHANFEFSIPTPTNLLFKSISVDCVEGNDCSGFLIKRHDVTSKVRMIKGRKFIMETHSGVAMSKGYEKIAYSTQLTNICVSVTLHITLGVPGLSSPYSPRMVTNVDVDFEKEAIHLVIYSFTIEESRL